MVMEQNISSCKDTCQEAMAAANEDIEAMNSMNSTNLDTLKQALNRLNELLQTVTASLSNPEEIQKLALEIEDVVFQAENAARLLASEAAKHTTEMINNAIASVNGGMIIVNSTASALRKVGEDVKIMADLLGEIDRSTHEQAKAIQEMNESIE